MNNGFSRWSNYKYNTKRIGFDCVLLAALLIIGLFAPEALFPAAAKIGFISLAFSKLIFVSCGVVHAHITRQLLFDYIDFNKETDPIKKIMIVGLYIIIIFCWARGG